MKLLHVAIAATSATLAAAGPFNTPLAFAAKAGDKMPSVKLHRGFPDPEFIDVADYVKGRNVIVVGLPGAFTPTCSSQQVPGYLENQDALKEAGVDEVLVYCVNDAAVMQAWAEDQGVTGSMVKMMGDPAAELTKALDVEMTDPGPPSVGIIGRCKRHALYVVDGVIKYIAISEAEGDPAGDDDPSATLAPAMLKAVKDA